MHFFLSYPKTKEIINFLEKILKKAGLLGNGNARFPYFIYTNYKINTIENIFERTRSERSERVVEDYSVVRLTKPLGIDRK